MEDNYGGGGGGGGGDYRNGGNGDGRGGYGDQDRESRRNQGDYQGTNWKRVANIDGPWNHQPLVGSVTWARLCMQNPSAVSIRQPYKFSQHQHPVAMRHRDIKLSPMCWKNTSEERVEIKSLGYDHQLWATGESAYTEDPSKDRIQYYATLFVPAYYLRPNATHLFDFDTSRKHVREFSEAVSFWTAAFGDLNVGITEKRRAEQSGIDTLYFTGQNGSLNQRLHTFVEVILCTDKYNSVLPSDPVNPEIQNMDAYALRQIVHPDNVAGFRIHWIIKDPTFHPANAIKKRVFGNQEERALISQKDLSYKQKVFVHNSNHSERIRKMLSGELAAEEEEKRREAEEQQKRDHEGEVLGDALPGEQAEPEEPGDDGSQAMEDNESMDDSEDGGGKKKKPKHKEAADPAKQKQRKKLASHKQDNFDSTALKLAETAVEPTPATYYRNVFTLEHYSRKVVHPYLRACKSPAYDESGLYTEDKTNGPLMSEGYDMHTINSPMHFVRVLNFENTVRLASLSVPRKEGIHTRICSVQADISNYFVNGDTFSLPFPHLVFEYLPHDMQPELNYLYRIPWHTSVLESQMSDFEARIARHQRAMVSLNGSKGAEYVKQFLNSPTKLFEDETLNLSPLPSAVAASLAPNPDGDYYLYGRSQSTNDFGDGKPPPSRLVKTVRAPQSLLSQYDDGMVESASLTAKEQQDMHRAASGENGFWGAKCTTEEVFGIRPPPAVVTESTKKKIYRSATSHSSDITSWRKQQLVETRKMTGWTAPEEAATDQQPKSNTARKTLEKLLQLSKAEEHGSKSEVSMYDKVFDGDTDESKRLLSHIRKIGNCALNDQLYAELAGGSQGGARGLLDKDQARGDGQGSRLDEIKAKLSSNIITGPFAKQLKKMTEKKIKLLGIVAQLPLKTEEANSKFLEKYGVEADVTQADGKTVKRQRWWTPEVEELYRRDILTRVMRLYQEEALDQALGILTLSNSELPPPHQGILIHFEERGDMHFFTPLFTTDLSMSRWGNHIAMELLRLEVMCNVHQAHQLMIHLLESFRFNVLRQECPLRLHMLVQGPPGTEKSESLKRLMAASLSSAFMTSDYQSKLSTAVSKLEEYLMQAWDEAPDWIIGDVARMSREQREARDRYKKGLSSMESSFQRNRESATKKGEREQESYRVSHIHSVLAFCNRIEPTSETSVLDRFRVISMCPSRRIDTSMSRRVLFSGFGNTDKEHEERYFAQKRDEHAVTGMAISLQNCDGIAKCGTALFSICANEALKEVERYLPLAGDRVRSALRGGDDELQAFIMSKAYDRSFCSEVSPMINWSDRADRVESSEELRLKDFGWLYSTKMFGEYVSLFASAQLPSRYDQVLYSMTPYLNEHLNLRRFEMFYAAVAHITGFTRQYLLPVYERRKIPLPDIKTRALERGETKVAGTIKRMGTRAKRRPDGSTVVDEDGTVPTEECEIEETVEEGDPDQCSLIKEFHDYEHKLEKAAVMARPYHPAFEYGFHVDNESLDEKIRREQAAKRQYSRKSYTIHNKKRGADGEEVPATIPADEEEDEHFGREMFQPTFVACLGSDYQFAKQMQAVINIYDEGIDLPTVQRFIKELSRITVTVPVLKGIDEPRADDLDFDGVETVDEDGNKRFTPKMIEVPVIEYKDTGRNSGYVRIATHFLMLVPHYLLYLCLSAHENMHTTPVSFPLPITHRGYPAVAHRWSVRPRAGRILRVENPRYVAPGMSEFLFPVDISVMTGVSSKNTITSNQKLAERSATHIIFTEDPEKYLWRKYLKDTHYIPRREQPGASWADETKTPEERFRLLAEEHYDAPGMTEKRIQRLHHTLPFFKSFKHMNYPEDILTELQKAVRIRKAEALRELRGDAPLDEKIERDLDIPEHIKRPQRSLKERLTKNEVESLKRYFGRKYEFDLEGNMATIDGMSEDQLSLVAQEEEDQEEEMALTQEEIHDARIKKARDGLRKRMVEAAAKNETARKDLCRYAELSNTHPSMRDQGDYDRLRKQYGNIDFVQEYLVQQVVEEERREEEDTEQILADYRKRIMRATHPTAYPRDRKRLALPVLRPVDPNEEEHEKKKGEIKKKEEEKKQQQKGEKKKSLVESIFDDNLPALLAAKNNPKEYKKMILDIQQSLDKAKRAPPAPETSSAKKQKPNVAAGSSLSGSSAPNTDRSDESSYFGQEDEGAVSLLVHSHKKKRGPKAFVPDLSQMPTTSGAAQDVGDE